MSAASKPALSSTSHSGSGAWVGLALVVATLLSWSSVPLFVTHFASRIDVWTSNGWRYGLSALFWLPVILIQFKQRTMPNGLWRACLLPATFNTLGQVAFGYSFYKVDPATATFGLRLQIVFIVIGAYMLFPAERKALKNPWAWLGILMVLGGIAGTIFGAEHERKSAEILGIASAVCSGMLFAAYGLTVRRNLHGYHPVTAFAAISQLTAAVMVGLMILLGHNIMAHGAGGIGANGAVGSGGGWDGGLSALQLGAGQFFLLFVSSMLGIAIGHVLYYYAIARLGVAISSGVIQIQPFGVAIGQYLFFNKPLTSLQVITGTVAVCGAVLLLYVQWKSSKANVIQQQDPGKSRCRHCGQLLEGCEEKICPKCGTPTAISVSVPGMEHAIIEVGEMDVVPAEVELRKSEG